MVGRAGDADQALVRRFLQRRDEKAFDALYRRHTPRMYGLALRLTEGLESEAGELVQEAWFRAVSRLGSFREDARLSTWLCGFCVNVWRENLRRARGEMALDSAPEPGRSALDETSLPYDSLDVSRALERLPPGYRAVLVLHSIFGYSHAEVAELLGISEGTSKSQHHRGKRALRNALLQSEKENTT